MQSLETQVNELKRQVKSLENEIVEIKVQFDLTKSDIEDQVTSELEDYKPQGLGVADMVDSKTDLGINNKVITESLKDIYKID